MNVLENILVSVLANILGNIVTILKNILVHLLCCEHPQFTERFGSLRIFFQAIGVRSGL